MIKSLVKIILGMFIGIIIFILPVLVICKAEENHKNSQFNNGICIHCNKKLEPFVDKFGNVVWLCDNCGYNFVD